MSYDIPSLLKKHKACLDEISLYFDRFFRDVDYTKKLPSKVKIQQIMSPDDLDSLLSGPGFYFIATDIPTGPNSCTLGIAEGLRVVYRGHSYNVRERIESHLFYDLYRKKRLRSPVYGMHEA